MTKGSHHHDELRAGSSDNKDSEKKQEAKSALKPCQVLVASDESSASSVCFDTACVAYPVVIPPWKSKCSSWKMYYYGRGRTWNGGHYPLLPTGWVGLAESEDGIHWTKVRGSEEFGSILAPSSNPQDFDSVQIGHGDIVIVSDDCWYMFYFGGSTEVISMDSKTENVAGFRMRVGRAVSRDQGYTWEKQGMVFDYDPAEGFFAAWPRVITTKALDGCERPWQMIYHVFDGKIWRVYSAYSTDQGATWTRRGVVLQGSEDDQEAWDHKGIGTRSVTPWNGGWLMVYEAVDKDFAHRLGTAFCHDPNCDGPWVKSPLNPILEPNKAPMPDWTDVVIGTPYVLPSEDEKSLWLYFVGIGSAPEDAQTAIGLVVSPSGELGHDHWSPVVL